MLSEENLVALALHIFDVEQLGEGDVVAGANVLTAAALAIANIHRSDTRIGFKDGTSTRVGSSALAAGGLTCALLQDLVFAPGIECQNNFLAHLENWERLRAAKALLPTVARGFDPSALLAPEENSTFVTLHREGQQFALAGTAASELTKPPTEFGKHEIHERPLIFSAVRSGRELKMAVENAHRRQIFAHIGADSPSTLADTFEDAAALMEGRLTMASSGEVAQGAIMVTVRTISLLEDDRCAWLARIPWLTDIPAGPLPIFAGQPQRPVLDRVPQRIECAVRRAFARRIDYHQSEPYRLRLPMDSPQRKWIAFLRSQETSWPGITGSARSFLVTLLFGFWELMTSLKRPDDLPLPVDAVEAFARWQVARMISARVSGAETLRYARIARVAEGLRHRLSAEPKALRELVRSFHRVPSADCESALGVLVDSGFAARCDKGWQLPSQNHDQSHEPLCDPAHDV